MRTIAIRRQPFKYLICEDFHADSNLHRDAMENNEGSFSFQENIYTFINNYIYHDVGISVELLLWGLFIITIYV